ncbi:hypothetical protein SAMN05660710_03715 [Paracoccus tibetensis]|uniref:Uncharacterized protein n=1 Tax=Paracoccus tibetensis TaxID=336292 RepID=A0A1G5K670_9RHOB|nr:hypothetical protein SAMN05660710_03715 [Paracoccus tibetensis]
MSNFFVRLCVGLGLALLILSILTGAFALDQNGFPILNSSNLSSRGWSLLFLGGLISVFTYDSKKAIVGRST